MSLVNEKQMNHSVPGHLSHLDKSVFRPSVQRTRKKAVAQLTLTSLVDAFTILVIYLLVATHIGGQEIQNAKNIQLPVASKTDGYNAGTDIAYINGRYLINDEKVRLSQLVEKLETLDEDKSFLNILADKKTDFEDLNAAVLAGLQAGYKQIRFVVKQEDEA